MFETFAFSPLTDPRHGKILIIIIAFVGFFLAERLYRAAPLLVTPKENLSRLGRNVFLYGMNSLLWPVLVAPVTLLAASAAVWTRPEGIGWWALPVDLIVLDVYIYAWHRANHEVPFLWHFHRVHHRDRFLDTTSAVRFHFGEVALSSCVRGLLLWALAMPFEHLIIFETLVLLGALFHHSNVRLPQVVDRLLAHVVVTPGWHWLHHHAVRRDTDSNYGTILTLWDRLFGSANRGTRRLNMEIGMEGTKKDMTLVHLLIWPFYEPRKKRSARGIEKEGH